MLRSVFEDVLELCENGHAPPTEAPTEADLIPLRDRIDALDRAILAMLNERAHCANLIGAVKKKIGLPIYMPGREQEVLDNVTGANTGPLANDAVRRLFERVIDETRSLERHLYQEEPES